LSSYMQLEKLRHNNTFDFEIVVDKKIEVEEIEIPPMMIQPFIENAIIHGVSQVKNGKVQLLVEQIDDYIHFRIIDNGYGFSDSQRKNHEHKSMALSILQERKDILKQKWQKNVEIKKIDSEMGTEIVVVLPII